MDKDHLKLNSTFALPNSLFKPVVVVSNTVLITYYKSNTNCLTVMSPRSRVVACYTREVTKKHVSSGTDHKDE